MGLSMDIFVLTGLVVVRLSIFIAVTEYLTATNWGKNWFILAHKFRGFSQYDKEAMIDSSHHGGQKTKGEGGLVLTDSLAFFFTVRVTAYRAVLPTSRVD